MRLRPRELPTLTVSYCGANGQGAVTIRCPGFLDADLLGAGQGSTSPTNRVPLTASFALWAGMVALMGKVIEDAGQRQPITEGMTGSQVHSTGFGPYRAYLPKLLQKRAQTLHSDFDLGDQYVESKSNARPLAATH